MKLPQLSQIFTQRNYPKVGYDNTRKAWNATAQSFKDIKTGDKFSDKAKKTVSTVALSVKTAAVALFETLANVFKMVVGYPGVFAWNTSAKVLSGTKDFITTVIFRRLLGTLPEEVPEEEEVPVRKQGGVELEKKVQEGEGNGVPVDESI